MEVIWNKNHKQTHEKIVCFIKKNIKILHFRHVKIALWAWESEKECEPMSMHW